MYEKVNPSHPDKVADRIAGALVDYAYSQQEDPRIAVEVLIGHGKCHIIAESSVDIPNSVAEGIVKRIAGESLKTSIDVVPQDPHLADNQKEEFRCGDNGIFKGTPVTEEQQILTNFAKGLYALYPTDGKHILDGDKLIICQSNVNSEALRRSSEKSTISNIVINPLGDWTGGTDVDTGATNRKLGSDMGDAVTGGGINGKDLSKADVSVNIFCHFMAKRYGKPYTVSCAIGDTEIDGIPYSEIVKSAKAYIKSIGGFEKFAEWGLIR